MSVERKALIDQAVKAGFNPELLERSPIYAIQAMLEEKEHPSYHRSRKKSRRRNRDNTQHVVEQLQKEAKTHENDDTETVVDMSFVTETDNPADQKYKRFSFLVCAKNECISAIKTNTNLLQSNQKNLDEDDVQALQKEIEHVQYQLNLITTEIKEIHQWFLEVHAQKQAFYKQFTSQMQDMSGNLTDHFQRKADNIQKYIQQMQEQTELNVNSMQ